MSHEIDTTTGRAAVFVAREPAWHRLGTVVAEAVTAEEAIRLACLDWTVEQLPLWAFDKATGKALDVPGRVANVRSDTKAVLGVVSPGYRPFQNAEAFAFLDEIVAEGGARYESAGALKGGRQVWMLARLPGELRATSEDVIHPYALLSNGHDGSMAVHLLPTTVRVVCNNTLTLALDKGRGKELVIRHSESLTDKVESARHCLGLVHQRLEAFQEEIDALARVSLPDTAVRDYFEGVLTPRPPAVAGNILDVILNRDEERSEVMVDLLARHQAAQRRTEERNAQLLEQLLDNFHNETNTLPGIAGTAWAAFNAVSEWADHQRPARGRTEEAKAENRLASVWFGQADAIKQEAYQQALALVGR